jgi:hypothetical protein
MLKYYGNIVKIGGTSIWVFKYWNVVLQGSGVYFASLSSYCTSSCCVFASGLNLF